MKQNVNWKKTSKSNNDSKKKEKKNYKKLKANQTRACLYSNDMWGKSNRHYDWLYTGIGITTNIDENLWFRWFTKYYRK